jgi:hypothetical protein
VREKEEEKRQEKAKERQHDAQALKVYKAQVNSFQFQIDLAGDNVKLRETQEKMLTTCKLLWADLVKKSEIDSNAPASGGRISKASLKDKLEKVDLMLQRAAILHDREPEQLAFSKEKNLKKGLHVERLKAWRAVSETMKEAVDTYESKVSQHLDEVEKKSAKAWNDALNLMKEE